MNSKQLTIFFAVFSLLLLPCCGKKMNSDAARKVIATELNLPESFVEVKQLSEIGGTVAADATLKLTFVLQKDDAGQYKILKIRYGTNRWQSPEEFRERLPESPLARSLHQAFLAELIR